MMNCNSCGAPVQTGAGFCYQCGAPVGGEAAVPVVQSEPPIRFTFEADALEFFLRGLLTALSFPFVIPVPWTLAWYWKWIAEQVRAGHGEYLRFWGAAANAWQIVLLYVLLFATSIGLSLLRSEGESNLTLFAGDIVIQLFSIALGWVFTKWFLDHVELRGRRWRFDGSVWVFVGWNLLLYLSFLTIIGWAWVLAGMYNWILSRLQNAGGTLQFVGGGHQVLWRTIAMMLFCLPIVTLPWAIRWYYAWVISQVQLTPAAEG
jgi:hypothetical protein